MKKQWLILILFSTNAFAYDSKLAKAILRIAYQDALKSSYCKSKPAKSPLIQFADQAGVTTGYQFSREKNQVEFSVDYANGPDFTFYFEFETGRYTLKSVENNVPAMVWIGCLENIENAKQCILSVQPAIDTINDVEKNIVMPDNVKKKWLENVSCPTYLMHIFKESLNQAVKQPEPKSKNSIPGSVS